MTRPELSRVQVLYSESRYLSAYRETRELWEVPGVVSDLSVEELVLGGRLASRLGSGKLSRWLFREAAKKEPASPLVRFHCRYASRRVRGLLDDLQDLDQSPALDSGDADLEADWYCWQSMIWAVVRDFQRAHQCLDRAADLAAHGGYYGYARAYVWLRQDRWTDARDAIEQAWRQTPAMPGVAGLTAEILTKHGRIAEAAQRLQDGAARGESYDLQKMSVWYQVALAEQAGAEERRQLAQAAYDAATNLAELAPLADRTTDAEIACYCFDAALLTDDRSKVREHAREGLGPFFDTVVEHMQANPDGKHKVMDYVRVQQKHDTCLPASAVAVLSAFGLDEDQEALAAALTYGGTPIWRVRKWAEAKGIVCRNFLVTPELTRRLLEAGIPFVLSFQAETYAHAVAVVGLDDFTGTAIIHDPNSPRWSRFLLERINANEAPFGPYGLILAPAEKAAGIDGLLPDDVDVYHREQDFWERAFKEGFADAAPIVDEIEALNNGHPVPRRLRAVLAAQCGRPSSGLKAYQALLDAYPDCLPLKNDMLNTVSRLGNTALATEILSSIVERRIVPGISADKKWQYPPATYVVRYVDLLRVSEANLPKARRLLRKAIRREPFFAESFHVLADMRDQELRFREALLPYRLAAHLQPVNDHYAESVAYAWRRIGNEEAGLQFLRDRVQQLGDLIDGGNAWQSLVRSLEMFGRPGAAIDALQQALEKHPDDDRLLSFAVYFWVNWGFQQAANEALAQLAAQGARLRYLEAAVYYHSRCGDWQEALPLCREWVTKDPFNMVAREHFLSLHAIQENSRAALATAKRWATEEHPERDDFEELYYDQLRHFFDSREQQTIVRQRVERTAEDGWAWQQLVHLLLEDYSVKPASKRTPDLIAELEGALAECERTAPHDAFTIVLKARFTEACGDLDDAREFYAQALEFDPENEFCYDRLFECSRAAGEAEWRGICQLAEERLQLCVGYRTAARPLAMLVAARFGVKEAETAIARWHQQAPRDPALAHARAELLLQYGEGQKGVEQAIEVLLAAVSDFPHHLSLQYSLANAYLNHFERDKCMAVLNGILQRDPPNAFARRQLATACCQDDAFDEAAEILQEGLRRNPLEGSLYIALARTYWQQNRYEDALQTYRDGLAKMPENISLTELYIDALLDLGRNPAAVQTAEDLTQLFPDGAYCWYLLGNTLARSSAIAARQEIEAHYRKALEHNAGLLPAVENLAIMYLGLKRVDDARDLFAEALPSLGRDDRCQARCRMAWITWTNGDKAAAVDEIREVLQEHPLNRAAWDLMLTWLEENEAWDELKEYLESSPLPLLEDPEFACQRLQLLAKAGVEQEALNAPWEKLLRNYPDNHYVHLERFDELWEREEYAAAAEVLAPIEPHHPRSPYILARKVKVLAWRDDEAGAIKTALAVWRLPGEDEWWPENEVWEAILGKSWALPASEEVLTCMLQGEKIRPVAFERLVDVLGECMNDRDCGSRVERKRPQRLFNGLLESLDQVSWNAGVARSVMFNKLTEMGQGKRVLQWWKKNSQDCEQSGPLWQSVGFALCSAGRYDDCREWMVDWRERPGLRMCSIADLSMSQRAMGDYEGMLQTSRDALQLLEHDHTVRYHILALCEAALRRDADEVFLQVMDDYRPDADELYEGCWMASVYTDFPAVCRRMYEFLRGDEQADLMSAARELHSTIGRAPRCDWLHWWLDRHLKHQGVSWWRRVLLHLQAWGQG